MSAPHRSDVHVLSQHIAITTDDGVRHFVIELLNPVGAVAFPANDHGHVEVRLAAASTSLPSFELCIERLLTWIANGRDGS